MPHSDTTSAAAALRLEVCDRVDDGEWEQLLRRDPRAHVAQRPRLVRALGGADARWCEVRDTTGSLRAGLAFVERARGPFLARVSGVGGTYGGPVAAPDDLAAEDLLAQHFTHPRARLAHVEMVWAHPVPPRGRWRGLRPLPTAELSIDPSHPFEDFLSEVFGRKGRKECNRSERRGLRAGRERDATAWLHFAPQLRRRSEHWGTRLPDPDVVARLLEENDEVELFVVRDDHDRVQGAHIVLRMPDELFAWIGTTARIEGANPATLLLREEARRAHELGLRRVNLGSSLGIGGVHRFKEMLGATEGQRWIVLERAWWRAWIDRRHPGGAR